MRVLNCLDNNDLTSHARLHRYAEWLLQLGEGKIPVIQNSTYVDTMKLISTMTVNTKEELIDFVYNNLLINYQN